MKKFLLAFVGALLLSACANDVQMYLPAGRDGQQGVPGLSAYDGWVDAVENGTINWDEDTDAAGFFRFLKGNDGENGIDGVDGLDGSAGENGTDGIDGLDGRSAYDLWVEAVGRGLDDPHNPGTQWDKTKTSRSDFFNFMMGRDGMNGMSGLSAYGLWVRDVEDADGLQNPHYPDDPTAKWPVEQTTIYDFWCYLRGEDGKDGQDGVVPPSPGQSGGATTPVAGKINVIAQYYNQTYSEYVNPDGGGVTYKVVEVVDGDSVPVAGAVVSDLPEISGKTYIAGPTGEFTVPLADLPVDGTNRERFGSCTVSYTSNQGGVVKTDETSAANTYVPQQVNVRLRITGNIASTTTNTNTLGGAAYFTVPVVVERRVTTDAEWTTIPAYLQTAKKYIYALELSDRNNPLSFPSTSVIRWNHLNIDPQEITTPYGKRIERPTVRWTAMNANVQSNDYHLWDEQQHFVNIVMESFYGQRAHANAVIEVPPVQFMPLPTAVEMTGYNSAGTGSFNHISGEFDTNGVNTAHLYEANMEKENKGTYDLYRPVQQTGNLQSFTLLFKSDGNNVFNPTPVNWQGNPAAFSFDGLIKVGCDVYLMASGRYFLSPGNATPIGVLKEEAGVFKIVPKDPALFEFSDIVITDDAP